MKFSLAAKIFLIFIAAVIIGAAYLSMPKEANEIADQLNEPAASTPALAETPILSPVPSETPEPELTSESLLTPPLLQALDRVTKKRFGTKVSPGDSPVSPEKFSGYHTGVDLEIFPGEENADVAVSAACPGKILYKNRVNGYGGVLMQSCRLENQDVTVLYGHLKLESINKTLGQEISAGEKIGILGKGFSAETGGERKHLHLAMHKGAKISLLGYVQNPAELDNWIDILIYLK